MDDRRRWAPIRQRSQPTGNARMDEEATNLDSRTKILGNSHLYRGPRTLKLGKWCPVAEFDPYTQRQFVTESNNINILADHRIWSTMKTNCNLA